MKTIFQHTETYDVLLLAYYLQGIFILVLVILYTNVMKV